MPNILLNKADCKSAGYAFDGSNPSSTTTQVFREILLQRAPPASARKLPFIFNAADFQVWGNKKAASVAEGRLEFAEIYFIRSKFFWRICQSFIPAVLAWNDLLI